MDDQLDELPPSPGKTSILEKMNKKNKMKDLKQSQSQVPRNEADQFKITKGVAKDEQGGNIN